MGVRRCRALLGAVLDRGESARAWPASGSGACAATTSTSPTTTASARSAVTIYEHLASGSMPLTSDPIQAWPGLALERVRRWIDAGCPRAEGSTPPRTIDMPRPRSGPHSARVRRNILDLDLDELAEYRAALEQLGATRRRAGLRMAAHRATSTPTGACTIRRRSCRGTERTCSTSSNGSEWRSRTGTSCRRTPPSTDRLRPASPSRSEDLSYVHPRTGEERPNPLRFAVAKDARSKACTA